MRARQAVVAGAGVAAELGQQGDQPLLRCFVCGPAVGLVRRPGRRVVRLRRRRWSLARSDSLPYAPPVSGCHAVDVTLTDRRRGCASDRKRASVRPALTYRFKRSVSTPVSRCSESRKRQFASCRPDMSVRPARPGVEKYRPADGSPSATPVPVAALGKPIRIGPPTERESPCQNESGTNPALLLNGGNRHQGKRDYQILRI
jgi:hypothetical protein